jgi:hypothetical protein
MQFDGQTININYIFRDVYRFRITEFLDFVFCQIFKKNNVSEIGSVSVFKSASHLKMETDSASEILFL